MDSRTALLNAPKLRRQIVAIAAPMMLFALAVVAATLVDTAFEAKAEQIASERRKLGNLHLLIAAAPGLAMVSDRAGIGPEFLPGTSAPLIQAAFQSRLGEIAEESGVDLLAVGNTPLAVRDGTRFAGLRASMTGTNSEIVGAIFAIEAAVPYLTIRTARIDASGTGANDGNTDPTLLLMQLQVEGALAPDNGEFP